MTRSWTLRPVGSRRIAAWALIACAALAVAPSCESAKKPIPADETGSREAFLAAYKVFMHPRCLNCHPVGDVPFQGEDSHLHAQNVKRGPDGHGLYGMKCDACHQTANVAGANLPPGVPKWHLPPASMAFEGKSPRELARQLKDPKRNGGKTVEGAIEHLESDPLVLWAWSPGDGRSVPPLSHAELVRAMRDWVDKGAATPD